MEAETGMVEVMAMEEEEEGEGELEVWVELVVLEALAGQDLTITLHGMVPVEMEVEMATVEVMAIEEKTEEVEEKETLVELVELEVLDGLDLAITQLGMDPVEMELVMETAEVMAEEEVSRGNLAE